MRIPPTEVGGLFKCFLNQTWRVTSNPTNGSWWIVQILFAWDLNEPPTAVDGIELVG